MQSNVFYIDTQIILQQILNLTDANLLVDL
jgi:hypothetical protein